MTSRVPGYRQLFSRGGWRKKKKKEEFTRLAPAFSIRVAERFFEF